MVISKLKMHNDLIACIIKLFPNYDLIDAGVAAKHILKYKMTDAETLERYLNNTFRAVEEDTHIKAAAIEIGNIVKDSFDK